MVNYKDRITFNNAVRTGKPCIRNLRVTVYDILGYLASGMTNSDILRDFPYLEEDDIFAALAYAADFEKSILIA
ncbi:DUF433 domain-containing protein [Leptospira sp. GIMC2001]|uniref:DUF433 domain-containing protein n=1 Tax=Leptospira sp. GIMC2001 TaxID=1513297 RepID=UPI00234B276B|nr:DUF433 domain-containing protein [Leptospira sp. GIMC2001]WCL48657.1 DUF433 domain-containing protein [Leptospira sp. GIMC2001]